MASSFGHIAVLLALLVITSPAYGKTILDPVGRYGSITVRSVPVVRQSFLLMLPHDATAPLNRMLKTASA